MSLLYRRIFSTVWCKSFLNHNELSLIRTQYYSSLKSLYFVNSQKSKKFGRQQISNLKAVRELNFDLGKAKNIFNYAFDKMFAPQKFQQKRLGFLWYKTLDELNVNEILEVSGLPDTYFSWFKIIGLHVWMILFHIKQEEKTNLRYIRDGVVEAMWLDMETRAHLLEQFNKNFKKNFKQLYETFRQQSLFWYDYGYLNGDIVLANVVWNMLFEREIDDPEKLEVFVRYIRYQMKQLEFVRMKSLDEDIKPNIWTSMKSHSPRLLS